jgi:Zn-dependent protease with chaperone function
MAPLYIMNPLAGGRDQMARLFSSHPSTQERISRLRSREWAR